MKVIFKAKLDQKAYLRFASPLQYADNMAALINETKRGKNWIIDLHLYSDDEFIDENLVDWEATSTTESSIEFRLEYKNPLQVSAGGTKDKLMIDVRLTEYGNVQDYKLPRMMLMADVPSQVASDSELDVFEVLNDMIGTAAGCAVLAFILSWLLGASMLQIWALLNILQFVSQLPMLNILFPANSREVHQMITEVATFQTIPTDAVD